MQRSQGWQYGLCILLSTALAVTALFAVQSKTPLANGRPTAGTTARPNTLHSIRSTGRM